MMTDDERIDARFDLPDTLTVRQQLHIRSRILYTKRDDLLPLWWEIGQQYMSNWQSDYVADPKAVNLDTETDPHVANVVTIAAFQIANWFNGLGNVEKN